MLLGRVIGRVVASQRSEGLQGQKFLIVQPLDEYGENCANSLVACDVVGSGLGDMVHICDGRESSLALSEPFVPVDATIVGHVEQFEHEAPAARASHRHPEPGRGPSSDGRKQNDRSGSRGPLK